MTVAEELLRLRAEVDRLRMQIEQHEQGLINAGRQLAATEDYWQAEVERVRLENMTLCGQCGMTIRAPRPTHRWMRRYGDGRIPGAAPWAQPSWVYRS